MREPMASLVNLVLLVKLESLEILERRETMCVVLSLYKTNVKFFHCSGTNRTNRQARTCWRIWKTRCIWTCWRSWCKGSSRTNCQLLLDSDGFILLMPVDMCRAQLDLKVARELRVELEILVMLVILEHKDSL